MILFKLQFNGDIILGPTEWLNQRIRILEKELRVADQLSANEIKKEPVTAQNSTNSAPTPTRRKDQAQAQPQK